MQNDTRRVQWWSEYCTKGTRAQPCNPRKKNSSGKARHSEGTGTSHGPLVRSRRTAESPGYSGFDIIFCCSGLLDLAQELLLLDEGDALAVNDGHGLLQALNLGLTPG